MDFKKHLSLLREAFVKNDIPGLKKLSSEFAGDAFVHYQRENIELSIIAYSCAKFLEKPYVVRDPAWEVFREDLLELLDDSREAWDEGKKKQAFASLAECITLIEGLSDDLGRFVFGTIVKARLKAGAEIYARGASLGTAAELSGAEKSELSAYISVTKMPEKYKTKSISQRMQDAKKVFS